MKADLLRKLIYVARQGQRDMANRLAPLGIAMGTHGTLFHCCSHPGTSQDELAEELMLNKSTVARAVAQLEQEGFVVRQRDAKDRRIYRVFPTQRALDCLEQVQDCKRETVEALTGSLSAQEVDQLSELVDKLYRGVLDGRTCPPAAAAQK